MRKIIIEHICFSLKKVTEFHAILEWKAGDQTIRKNDFYQQWYFKQDKAVTLFVPPTCPVFCSKFKLRNLSTRGRLQTDKCLYGSRSALNGIVRADVPAVPNHGRAGSQAPEPELARVNLIPVRSKTHASALQWEITNSTLFSFQQGLHIALETTFVFPAGMKYLCIESGYYTGSRNAMLTSISGALRTASCIGCTHKEKSYYVLQKNFLHDHEAQHHAVAAPRKLRKSDHVEN